MAHYLPVPPPPPDVPDQTAQNWETAVGGPGPSTSGPTHEGPRNPHGGSVAMYRTGPGDYEAGGDEWMGEDIFVVGREGVMTGEMLFDRNVPQPPNEGHGEYSFAQDGPFIDHSTRNLALFISPWDRSTALQAGGRGSFTGEHIVIQRVVPGSTQGYMPTGTEQLNTVRDQPGPWDQQLLVGRQEYIDRMRASTSM
jgi:hypothetical protein